MTRPILPLLPVLLLAAPLAAQDRPFRQGGPDEDGPPRIAYASPSAGIAADIALARLTAEKKGRWYALRKTAADDAVMFVPGFVLAQPWLKQRKDIGTPVKLQPYRAWASCDGSLVVTSGRRQEGGIDSWYSHVWQRQDDGSFKWVFAHAGNFAGPETAPDMIEAKVADCPPRRLRRDDGAPPRGKPKKQKPPPVVFDPTGRRGASEDGSLTWEVAIDPAGGHRFTAAARTGNELQTIRDERVPR